METFLGPEQWPHRALCILFCLGERGQLRDVDGMWGRGVVGEMHTQRKDAGAFWTFWSISIVVFKLS